MINARRADSKNRLHRASRTGYPDSCRFFPRPYNFIPMHDYPRAVLSKSNLGGPLSTSRIIGVFNNNAAHRHTELSLSLRTLLLAREPNVSRKDPRTSPRDSLSVRTGKKLRLFLVGRTDESSHAVGAKFSVDRLEIRASNRGGFASGDLEVRSFLKTMRNTCWVDKMVLRPVRVTT